MNGITAPERHAAAQAIGVHEQYLYQFLSGHRKPPPERCPAIELHLYPKVTCEQLRPDVRWVRISDPAWPHPQGRPCVDVAGPVQQEAA